MTNRIEGFEFAIRRTTGSLGHRSILADVRNADTIGGGTKPRGLKELAAERANHVGFQTVARSEGSMAGRFAPIVLAEKAADWFDGCPMMGLAFAEPSLAIPTTFTAVSACRALHATCRRSPHIVDTIALRRNLPGSSRIQTAIDASCGRIWREGPFDNALSFSRHSTARPVSKRRWKRRPVNDDPAAAAAADLVGDKIINGPGEPILSRHRRTRFAPIVLAEKAAAFLQGSDIDVVYKRSTRVAAAFGTFSPTAVRS